jgi:hypothetical protein
VRGRVGPATLAVAAVLLFWLWQFLTVRYNYGGNWTGLFCIAPHMPVPAFLKSEHLYIFRDTQGFDGQIYHLIAHDPWMRRGAADAILSPTYRYQRILVPGLAWCLALGRDDWIHPAYFAVILAFVFLGVYWLSQIVARAGLNPVWGLIFAFTPATIISIDRMTVDIALAALTLGFAFYAEACADWQVTAILACAGLTRETAVSIIAAYALFLITRKRFRAALLAAVSALPAVAWFAYLARARPESPELAAVLGWIPLAGLVDALLHPWPYSLSPFKNAVAVIFDYVAQAGVIVTLALSIRLAIQRRWSARTSAIYALAFPALFIRSGDFWPNAYGFGRPFTPLFLLVALQDLQAPWLAFLPMFLVDTRISLNLVSQVQGVARGLFHGMTRL